jgi:hypothetical protein
VGVDVGVNVGVGVGVGHDGEPINTVPNEVYKTPELVLLTTVA